MTAPLARHPRLAAWLVVLVLLLSATSAALLGLQSLEPRLPAHLEHVHADIVAVRATGVFAARVPGQRALLWFHPALGAHISEAHLLRHLREKAPTDIAYQEKPHALLVAWYAD